MGKDLYDQFPVAREIFDEFDHGSGGNLKQAMFYGPKVCIR